MASVDVNTNDVIEHTGKDTNNAIEQTGNIQFTGCKRNAVAVVVVVVVCVEHSVIILNLILPSNKWEGVHKFQQLFITGSFISSFFFCESCLNVALKNSGTKSKGYNNLFLTIKSPQHIH